MSLTYPGGFITKNPTAPTASSSPGMWTIDQALQNKKAGNWPPNGPFYVEEVFSSYVYTGNGSTQTITNGIDLSGKGGLVWTKSRTANYTHYLGDSVNGNFGQYLKTPTSDANQASSDRITGTLSTGYTLGSNAATNNSSEPYVSWTFRKQPKFFDIVTYTGTNNGTTGTVQTIAHNLGSTPGMIIVKGLNIARSWFCYHTSLGATKVIQLDDTGAPTTDSTYWNDTSPTSTHFTVGGATGVNLEGYTYIAYLFAHDAGGFGQNNDQSVVKCGSFTHNGTSTEVNLGWEPQWLLLKRTDSTGYWELYDNIRGFGTGAVLHYLYANASFAESSNSRGGVTATGITWGSGLSSGDYIYVAIRRGPMKKPTDATKVFIPITYTGTGAARTLTTGFPADFIWNKPRSSGPASVMDRLRNQGVVRTTSTDTESAIGTYAGTADIWENNTGLTFVSGSGVDGINESGISTVVECFSRAPGFFDVVCYTGTGTATTVTHNLGVAPELIIVKPRDQSLGWPVWNSTIYAANADNIMYLNETGGQQTVGTMWNSSAPTSTTFPVGTNARTNGSAKTFVAYLFASCPGVSKIGSMTIASSGTLNVDCGFTNGSRFVMIKRTDSSSDWLVFDSARGIVAGDDPYLGINITSAENYYGANDNIDPYSPGFSIPMNTFSNLYGTGTYIYLAIA